jgi:hypothetical protein
VYRVINIRGSHGSGKSHLVRAFMAKCGAKPIYSPAPFDLLEIGGPIEAYHCRYKDHNVYIIGPYIKDTGGCDTVKSLDDIDALVKRYHKKGHVIFEGAIITTIYNHFKRLSDDVGGMIWANLNTPLQTCIKRVTTRNKGRDIDLFYIRSKFLSVVSTMRHAIKDNEIVVELDHKNALPQLCDLIDQPIPQQHFSLPDLVIQEKKSPSTATAPRRIKRNAEARLERDRVEDAFSDHHRAARRPQSR